MKLINLKNQIQAVDVRQTSYPLREESKSKLQSRVSKRLQEKFPRDIILEEFIIPGTRLSLDFFLPNRMIAVEVDGRQHSEFIPHFHGDILSSNKFCRQLNNDTLKETFCELNEIKLVRVKEEKDIETIWN